MTKIALITGASSGIGAGAARALARRSVDSIVTFNTDERGAWETVATIEAAGGRAVALPLDTGRTETFSGFLRGGDAGAGGRLVGDRLDYLVNNAGAGQMGAFADTDETRFGQFSRVILKESCSLPRHCCRSSRMAGRS